MEATNRLQRSRLALVTLGHFLNDSYGSFFTPILPVLIEKLSLWMMRVGSALEVGPPRLTEPAGAAPHASGRQSASAVWWALPPSETDAVPR